MATLLSIKTRASERMNDTSFVTNSEAFYNQCVNDAQREIQETCKILYETSTISSVDGTQLYDLPSNYMSMFDDNNCVLYTDTNSVVHYLNWATYNSLKNRFDDLTTEEGTPTYFWIQDDRIGFYKIPDYSGSSNVSIIHYYYPATMSSNSTTSDLPDKYQVATVYLTCKFISERNELYQESEMWNNKYLLELNRIDNTNDPMLTAHRSSGSEYIGVRRPGIVGRGTL